MTAEEWWVNTERKEWLPSYSRGKSREIWHIRGGVCQWKRNRNSSEVMRLESVFHCCRIISKQLEIDFYLGLFIENWDIHGHRSLYHNFSSVFHAEWNIYRSFYFYTCNTHTHKHFLKEHILRSDIYSFYIQHNLYARWIYISLFLIPEHLQAQ